MLLQLAGLGIGFVGFYIVFQFGGFCSVVEVDGVVSGAEVGDGLDLLLVVPCVCLGDAGSAAGPGQLLLASMASVVAGGISFPCLPGWCRVSECLF